MIGELAKRLRAGETLIGTFVTIGHPAICEIIADDGFDFLVLDGEHGYVPSDTTELLIAAAHGVPVIVRVPVGEAPWVGMALDAGADGILVPQVNSMDAAVRVTQLARYPPMGIRGLGASRATGYGSRMGDYLGQANHDVLVAIQVESREALTLLPQLSLLQGIDMLFVGPGDLSVSLGIPGALDHPLVWQGISDTLEAARSGGLLPGIWVANEDQARHWLAAGFGFVVVSYDAELLRQGLVDVASLKRSQKP